MYAFSITVEDVENILAANTALRTAATPIPADAAMLFDALTTEDFAEVEEAALRGGEDLIEEQLPAAYEALRGILVRRAAQRS